MRVEEEWSVSVCFIGSNSGLLEICRTVLDELCPNRYKILPCGEGEVPDGADIYIWEAGAHLPAAMARGGPATKLVVVSKSSFVRVRSGLPPGDFVFLQSPVTRLAMRVFLESTIARLELRRGESPAQVSLNRNRILQRLLETNLKLQEYDRDRTNFLTRAIHDLRVPLMAVQGYCGLLLAGQLGKINPEQSQTLEKMQRSLARLEGLTTAMMDLGAGSHTPAKLNAENASLEACVNQAIYETLPFAEQKQISVRSDLEPPSGLLLFDCGQLEQVLVNLLDNGCKFTPKRGSIEIRGFSVSGETVNGDGVPRSGYQIDVRDTGPGIPPEHVERIFDEYTSYGGSSDRSGAGLGLAICRMIIQAHNGKIWAASGGHGAVFSFVLPYIRTYIEQPSAQAAFKEVM